MLGMKGGTKRGWRFPAALFGENRYLLARIAQKGFHSFKAHVADFVVDRMPRLSAEYNLGHTALKSHDGGDHGNRNAFARRPPDERYGPRDALVTRLEGPRRESSGY